MSGLTRFFSVLIVAVCGVFGNSVLADSTAAESLRKHLDAMNTLQGSFTQTLVDAQGAAQETSSGIFMLMRPGKFYWETQSPMPQTLVSNGKTIWLYDPDLETVNTRAFTDDLRQTPALLLSEDVAKLKENFSISEKKSGELVSFTLVPKVTEGLFQQLTLVFKKGNLSEFAIEDTLGQVTRCVLGDVKRNQPLPEEKFYFQIPAGVEVITN